MTGIPVTIELDRETFAALEQIARKRSTSMRQLIVAHIRHSLNPEPYTRTVTTSGAPVKRTDVDAWIEAASMGVTNRTISNRWGVSEKLVSRCLNDRGVYRQKRHTDE